jgi:septum site-determining protein MinC
VGEFRVGLKKDIVIFKGSREGLTILCDDKADWNEVMEDLRNRLQGREGAFFAGASVVLNIGKRILTPEQVSSIWHVFQENKLSINSLKRQDKSSVRSNLNLYTKEKTLTSYMGNPVSNLPTLVVTKNIRSGQDITFDGNVIVYGDVKPGSKITVTGFILVLGNLIGTVHAGAEGDETAWVAAMRLQPGQLRIAGYITRAPDEKPQEPEIARISQGSVVVTEWKNSSINLDITGGIN